MPTPPADLAAGSDREFAHTVTTGAAPDRVWALWTDVAGWPAWDPELRAAELSGPFAVGAEGLLTPAAGPRGRFRVTALDPGRSYTIETALPLGALRVRRSWVAEGGAVAFTHAVSFHGAGGRVLSRRLGPRFRRALPDVMRRLAALAESAP